MQIWEDIEQWNSASESERKHAVAQLEKRGLKHHFSFLNIKLFTCNNISNHVARFKHNATGMTFHLIPGGSFYPGLTFAQIESVREHYKMDATEQYFEDDESGLVHVHPFLISEYLITEGAWEKFDGAKLFRTFGDEYPVDAIKHDDANKWCQKAGLMLPTELQWEYACKAGSNSLFYWGDNPDLNYAWTNENRYFDIKKSRSINNIEHQEQGETGSIYHTYTAAEQKLPNAFGLLGMIGNLGEYVSQCIEPYAEGSEKSLYAASTLFGDSILRGGWNEYDWSFNRSTSRILCAGADTGCSARAAFSLKQLD